MSYQLESPADGHTPELTETQQKVAAAITDAITFIDSELTPARAEATRYYLGKPFGNEEEGRSQVVMTEVRDAISGMMPSVMRVLFGAERCVEFLPNNPEEVDPARQATDYVQHVFVEENDGFLKSLAVVQDGMVRRLGIFKWGWEPEEPKGYTLAGVTQQQLEQLAQDPDAEITKITPSDIKDEQGQPMAEVEVTVKGKGRPVVWTVPPEEFIFSREARSLEDGMFVGHRMEKTRSELIALGIDSKLIDEHGGPGDADQLRANIESIERREVVGLANLSRDPETGRANDKILYVEGYMYLADEDEDTASLKKVCTIGPSYYLAHVEPCDERPFAIFCPKPEPHTIAGLSVADHTMDIQKVKSAVVRATLDSASVSIFPRLAYEEGQVSVADLNNNEVGATIRMRKQGAIQPIQHTFIGADMLQVLSYLDDVVERRTGVNKGSMGLDADALQSSTKQAVSAAVTSAQGQTELMVRVFCEQTLKRLFRGLLKLMVEHQPRQKMAQLRGQWVEIDPAAWNASWGMKVNVAFGASMTEQRVAILMETAAKQEQLLQMLGPGNPIVTVGQLAHTYQRILELHGIKDTTSFFNALPLNYNPPPPAAPPKSPEQTIAEAQLQIEQLRTQRELAIKEAELQLKREQQRAEFELKVRQAAMDFELRRFQIEAQFKMQETQQQVEENATQAEHWLEGAKAAHDATLQQQQQQHEQALQIQQQQHEQSLAQDQQQHEQALAEQQAAQADNGQDSGPSE